MTKPGIIYALMALGLTLSSGSSYVLAGAHTWDVNEMFSNADGTIQFIELRESGGGNFETGVGGHLLTSNTKSFTITSNVASPTGFKHILFGTAAFAALPGAPTPNYIIPANFFSISGDTITYNPYDSRTFGAGALPIDGVRSLNNNLTTGVNSPTNYAGQTGSVNAAPAPPAVPDGSAGSTPVSVVSLDSSGSSLSISWDTSSCSGAGSHHLIYGQGSQLPAAPGGVFAVAGSACGMGSTSPFIWDPSPGATDGTGLSWWLVVVGDGASTEGSWGLDSAGVERRGPGAGGSSGQCGATTKNVSNTCGQ